MAQYGYFCWACHGMHGDHACPKLKFEPQLSKISDGGSTTTPDTIPSHVKLRARRFRLEDLVFTFIALFGLYLWLRRLAK